MREAGLPAAATMGKTMAAPTMGVTKTEAHRRTSNIIRGDIHRCWSHIDWRGLDVNRLLHDIGGRRGGHRASGHRGINRSRGGYRSRRRDRSIGDSLARYRLDRLHGLDSLNRRGLHRLHHHRLRLDIHRLLHVDRCRSHVDRRIQNPAEGVGCHHPGEDLTCCRPLAVAGAGRRGEDRGKR